MEKKSFLAGYKISAVLTIVMLVAVSGALYAQGYFANEKAQLNPAVFKEMKVKVVFDGQDPELLAYIPAFRLSEFQTLMGDPVPGEGAMVLGFEEARDMTAESNITISQALWGYTMNDFLGGSIKVTGMLKKTNSLIDMMHILSEGTFNYFPAGEWVEVKLTAEKMPKFFYYINKDGSNWPKNITFEAGDMSDLSPQLVERTFVDRSIGRFSVQIRENKTYQPLVLGSGEAKMMMDEKILANVGDRLDGFFGRDVYVAGVLAPTGTVLDMFHYMPAG